MKGSQYIPELVTFCFSTHSFQHYNISPFLFSLPRGLREWWYSAPGESVWRAEWWGGPRGGVLERDVGERLRQLVGCQRCQSGLQAVGLLVHRLASLMRTVEPPNKGRLGTSHFVLRIERLYSSWRFKMNYCRGPKVCPLLGGCLFLRGSFIWGSTVNYVAMESCLSMPFHDSQLVQCCWSAHSQLIDYLNPSHASMNDVSILKEFGWLPSEIQISSVVSPSITASYVPPMLGTLVAVVDHVFCCSRESSVYSTLLLIARVG